MPATFHVAVTIPDPQPRTNPGGDAGDPFAIIGLGAAGDIHFNDEHELDEFIAAAVTAKSMLLNYKSGDRHPFEPGGDSGPYGHGRSYGPCAVCGGLSGNAIHLPLVVCESCDGHGCHRCLADAELTAKEADDAAFAAAQEYRSGDRVLWTGSGPNHLSQDTDAPGTVTGITREGCYFITLDSGSYATADAGQLRPAPELCPSYRTVTGVERPCILAVHDGGIAHQDEAGETWTEVTA